MSVQVAGECAGPDTYVAPLGREREVAVGGVHGPLHVPAVSQIELQGGRHDMPSGVEPLDTRRRAALDVTVRIQSSLWMGLPSVRRSFLGVNHLPFGQKIFLFRTDRGFTTRVCRLTW